MTRKSDLKQELATTKEKLELTQTSLNSMVKMQDLLTIGAKEQKNAIDELKLERSLFSFAFATAAGRLFAHQSEIPDLNDFVEALFAEIRSDYDNTFSDFA